MDETNLQFLRAAHGALLECVEYADEIIAEGGKGFYIDAICAALSRDDQCLPAAFQWLAANAPPDAAPVEYDGIVAPSWHQAAHEWIDRLLRDIAARTDRTLTTIPLDDGRMIVQLLPPIFDDGELRGIRIPYSSPKRLGARLTAEFARSEEKLLAVDVERENEAPEANDAASSFVGSVDLPAVLKEGLLAAIRAADRADAVLVADTVMGALFENNPEEYGRWTMDKWARHIGKSKKTIVRTCAWEKIKEWREENKRDRKVS